ncbi:MAG: helix-turn-helix domain-containing protein, partial [Candidatus Aminicenantes bacterium]
FCGESRGPRGAGSLKWQSALPHTLCAMRNAQYSCPLAARGQKRLEFYYTAVSFINPQEIRFRLRLVGYDRDWVDRENLRSITYTGLSPGHYTFKVTACNADGVWNREGAFFSFYLQPYFYQTGWFFLGVVFFVLLVVFLVYCFRRRYLRVRERRELQKTLKWEIPLLPGKTLSRGDKEFIRELQKVIDANLADPDFNVEELGRKLYMSRVTLYRKIHALTGETPGEFLRSCRLQKGAELLKSNFGTVLEVALEVGFSSANYFTKCFKKKFNQLPTEYQASKVE